jgi:hypothetical protein
MMIIAGLLRSPLMKYAMVALAVILTSFGVIQYIQEGAKETLIKDIQIEQVKDNQKVIVRTNDAIDKVRRITPDADAARQWLLDRQQ